MQVVAAITVAELLVGVETADAARQPDRQAFVDEVLALIPVEEYTTDVARVHIHIGLEGSCPRSFHSTTEGGG
ncbi:hypothetical protein ABZ297_07530 [Nonomuraea sp. NPDC005983]|uniref:hypothetical protein n=1 Tax=Nonomuraea sp. NPDC005983 TaxID=3155595 RepID=UPI0033A24CDB